MALLTLRLKDRRDVLRKRHRLRGRIGRKRRSNGQHRADRQHEARHAFHQLEHATGHTPSLHTTCLITRAHFELKAVYLQSFRRGIRFGTLPRMSRIVPDTSRVFLNVCFRAHSSGRCPDRRRHCVLHPHAAPRSLHAYSATTKIRSSTKITKNTRGSSSCCFVSFAPSRSRLRPLSFVSEHSAVGKVAAPGAQRLEGYQSPCRNSIDCPSSASRNDWRLAAMFFALVVPAA